MKFECYLEHYGVRLPSMRVANALYCLWRIENSAYRVLTFGGSKAVKRMALKMKTRALIRHDRILRAQQ